VSESAAKSVESTESVAWAATKAAAWSAEFAAESTARAAKSAKAAAYKSIGDELAELLESVYQ